MSVQLYLSRKPVEIHIAGENTAETFCGIDIEDAWLVGTIDAPASFTPQPAAIHDECLTEFLRRHDRNTSSYGEDLGWEDMGDSSR